MIVSEIHCLPSFVSVWKTELQQDLDIQYTAGCASCINHYDRGLTQWYIQAIKWQISCYRERKEQSIRLVTNTHA